MRKIHRVVEKAQDVDLTMNRIGNCAEQYEVPPPSPSARSVQREKASPDLRSSLDAGLRGASNQYLRC